MQAMAASNVDIAKRMAALENAKAPALTQGLHP